MKPDLQMAGRFLGLLDPNGVFTFQTFSDRQKTGSLNRVLHGTLDRYAAELVRLNQCGAGVFVMVNEGDGVVHPGAKTCRKAANVIRVRSLFVDLDGAPIEPVISCSPDIIVESSPARWHPYWLVENCPLDEFTAAQKGLIEKFSSDPVIHDLNRVMRLPGFYHQKRDPFMTRLIWPE